MRIRAIVSGKERQAQIAVTPKLTVGQALAAMGISLAALDQVTPNVSALARDGLSIRVTRISTQVQKRRTPIATELRYKPTTALRAGAKQTIQEARAGAVEITERVWLRDGKVSRREFVSKRVAVAPRHKIVALGVQSHLLPSNVRPHRRYARALSYRGGTPRDRMLAPADPKTFAPVRSLKVTATGYSAGPAGGAIGNWTATGVRCTYGAVAVDPRVIPLGSKLYIEGYGYGFACDTGGAIKGRKIDLAFNSPRAAFAHGRRQTKVWILGP
jgi:3D (Asp-Asp-Asp) domain-containing protein